MLEPPREARPNLRLKISADGYVSYFTVTEKLRVYPVLQIKRANAMHPRLEPCLQALAGRLGFGPTLSLSYNSGASTGVFGLGWNLSLPSIRRKPDNGPLRYIDTEETDIFVRSAPDLMSAGGVDYRVQCYRPRIEGLFARIERWTHTRSGETHWRSISRDNPS
jgi:Salmonella virulence plasmid 65kDa B protein